MIDQLQEDISGKHGKILKVRIQTKRKSILTLRINEKAHLPITSGRKTHIDVTQAHQQTAMLKAVVGRLHLGVAAP